MKGYLADACALIDFYTGDPALPTSLRAVIENETPKVAVVATTVWEIAIKTRLGKLVDVTTPEHRTLADMLRAQGYELLPFDRDTAEQAAALPLLHKDPFDRALIAAAQRTRRSVLTSDAIIRRYDVSVRW